MTPEHVATEYVDGVLQSIHYLVLPEWGTAGVTAQIRSMEGFRRRMQQNLRQFMCADVNGRKQMLLLKNRVPGQTFHLHWADDFEQTLAFERRSFGPKKGPHDLVPSYHHDSIYKFFIAIGYEYRLRRLKSWAGDVRRDKRTPEGRRWSAAGQMAIQLEAKNGTQL